MSEKREQAACIADAVVELPHVDVLLVEAQSEPILLSQRFHTPNSANAPAYKQALRSRLASGLKLVNIQCARTITNYVTYYHGFIHLISWVWVYAYIYTYTHIHPQNMGVR